MDPRKCLINALECLVAMQDEGPNGFSRMDAVEYLRDLAEWLDSGGFAPNVVSADWDWPSD